MYIVLEGQDGTGKSTQARILKEHFETKGYETVVMDEPDGDLPQAHKLHDLILVDGKDYALEPMTNVLLFTAARVELWQKIIRPTLCRGGVVISARNWWSTLAYQGYGEGISCSQITRLTREALPEEYVVPSHGIILVASGRTRSSRQLERGKDAETFEVKADSFQKRVSNAYLRIAHDFRIPVVDASGPIEYVTQLIFRELAIF